MKTIFIRGEIVGENEAGRKRVKILANNADGLEFWTDDKSILSELLFAQPQPEIIRCKECKKFESREGVPYGVCTRFGYAYKPDDFCSRAERGEQ